ncbi:hypothetical protein SLCG_2714 [Streptomyces lincolnensis]|uniref:hypothetical protein n=1 Tax=Streptomyces lincolnensis TaxID=1915 RepID=UPI00082E3781|nr:hypothetical protein [Streptomyces lincolnensis]AXG53869.1 hypothetical protein SLCG_2714 [Streptomyces lincolnensis]QMV09579.1 hypothetical protein GJU35_30625 [Streptomyces lincolnensis]
MKSEHTPFEGGPMDGRVLPVLVGPTGHPPKIYRIPVPDAAGGPPTVLVYRRVPRAHSKRLGIQQGWKYEYDPQGRTDTRLKWPWSKPETRPEPEPEPGPESTPEPGPDATPGGKPDDAHG